MIELMTCPFCGGKMKFHRDHQTNRDGREYYMQYWMHEDDTNCILDDIVMPFTIGAGDARLDDYDNPITVGEYGEKWNERVPIEWIPISDTSDRLPEGDEEVLTYLKCGMFEINSLYMDDVNEALYWENQHGDTMDFEGVVAWMPLPPDYKEKQE